MDALYAVLEADTPHARRRVLAQTIQIRAVLAPLAPTLASNPEAAPALLGIALMECRMAGISIAGIIALVSQVYGRDLSVREISPLEKMETEGKPQ